MHALAIIVSILLVLFFWRLFLPLALIALALFIGTAVYVEKQDAQKARYEASPAGLAEKARIRKAEEQRAAEQEFERAERIKLSHYWRGVAIPANGDAVYFGPYPQQSLSECQMDLLRALRKAGSLLNGEGRCALVDPNRVGSLAAEVKVVEYVMGQWPVH